MGDTYNDDDDIETWMARRQGDVDNAPADYAAGQLVFAAANQSGRNVRALTPGAVRALGANLRAANAGDQGQDAVAVAAQPAPKVGKAILSDKDIAGIIYNETRSLSGPDVQTGRQNLAHTIMNGDEKWGERRIVYAKTAPSTANPGKADMAAYQASVDAVREARARRAKEGDPTNGSLYFRLRPNGSSKNLYHNVPVKTQVPAYNSFVNHDVPSNVAFIDTF